MSRVRFSVAEPGCDRVHRVGPDDVRVVLARLPRELWSGLRQVHFNDRGFGARILGTADPGAREISLCALPPRVSLTASLRMGLTPEYFGARRGRQWPQLAVRRYLLYNTFLHELGHLQVVANAARRPRRLRIPKERFAEEFAIDWCGWLWSQPFAHADPVHNPPTADELLAPA